MIQVDKQAIISDILPELKSLHKNLFYLLADMNNDESNYMSDKTYMMCSTYVYGQLAIKRIEEILEIPDEEMQNYQDEIQNGLNSIKNFMTFINSLNDVHKVCLTMQ